MKFSNSNKALAITLLIVGTIVLSVVNIDLYRYNAKSIEMLVDVTIEKLPNIVENADNFPRTNKGFNEAKKQKHFAQAYKTIAPPKDFKDARLANAKKEAYTIKKAPQNNTGTSINKDEFNSFRSVNTILNKKSNTLKSSMSNAKVNKNSAITYYLKNRTDTHLPIPVYLCETKGKIVVNITVNNHGRVTNTAINKAVSNSSNACLLQHSLEFAKEASFNTSAKTTQVGTITFYFEGKQ